MPSLLRASLALAVLLVARPASAQPLPPQEASAVSSGMPAAAPSALPSEAPRPDELQPAAGPAPDAGQPTTPVSEAEHPEESARVAPPMVEPATPLVSPNEAAFETRVKAPGQGFADLHFLVPETVDRVEVTTGPDFTNPGTGVVQQAIVNPKLQIVFTPLWDIDLDGGGAFHSNDARAVILSNGSGALPRAWGAEVGTRLSLIDGRLDLAAPWFPHLQSEQVLVADEGGTVASDPTNAYGLDLAFRFQILPWLRAELDLSFAHAEYAIGVYATATVFF